ncbi:MAG: flagellar biosynthesis protein FlhB [Alphaproteobacteria bacterium]|nr:flagellar biosynthesis protein FlhB [Alphaproteobacteria bacterium]
MAEDHDPEQATEEASSRRLDEARKRGQVALSREVGSWLTLAATGAVLSFLVPALVRDLAKMLTHLVASPHLYTVDRNLADMVRKMLGEIGLLLLLPVLLMAAAGLAGPLLQNGFVVALERLQPKFSHLSPAAGFKRLLSGRNLVEFGKSLVKLAVVGGVVWVQLRPELNRLILLPSLDIGLIPAEIAHLVARMMAAVIAIMAVVSILDVAYQRFSFRRSMRMTKQEVKEEYRDAEGDPRIKGKLRQLRAERARRRMMAAVPKATVVVANPTHYAVACKYEMETMRAPVVVAKGTDLVALRIREIAAANGVPVVENPPLARALYAAVEIDAEIPAEHYKAVAEIIGYVFRLQGKLRSRNAPPPG